MLAAVAIVPGSPSLVPALTGPDVPDLAAPRTAVRQVGERLAFVAPRRWIALCARDVHDPAPIAGDGVVRGDLPVDGTYLGFGVDVRVRLRPGTPPDPVPDRMATTVLAAAWLRGEVAPEVTVDPVLVDPAIEGARLDAAADLIVGLLTADEEPTGLLVVADGSTGLTPKAPGGLIEGAEDLQATVDAAIAAGDVAAIAALDVAECARARIDGRAPLQIAAQAWRRSASRVPVVESLWCGTPLGVGGHVAWWVPAR